MKWCSENIEGEYVSSEYVEGENVSSEIFNGENVSSGYLEISFWYKDGCTVDGG